MWEQKSISKKLCLFAFSIRKYSITVSCLSSFFNFHSFSCSTLFITDASDKIKCFRLSRNPETQQEKVLKRISYKDNWNRVRYRSHLVRVMVKNDFMIILRTCQTSLFLKLGKKTYSKNEQIKRPYSSKEKLKIHIENLSF